LLFFNLKAETKEKLKNHQPLSPNFALTNWSTLSQTRNGATNPLNPFPYLFSNHSVTSFLLKPAPKRNQNENNSLLSGLTKVF
jgi:hypothetical protein